MGFLLSQCLETGGKRDTNGQVQAPFAGVGSVAGVLASFFLSLPLAFPAKLGFPGFWLSLRGLSASESPQAGLERNCQPETTREPPSLKTGGEKGRKHPEKDVLLSSPGKALPDQSIRMMEAGRRGTFTGHLVLR